MPNAPSIQSNDSQTNTASVQPAAAANLRPVLAGQAVIVNPSLSNATSALLEQGLPIAPVGIYVVPYTADKGVYALRKAMTLLEYPAAQITDFTEEEVLTFLHAEDQPRLSEYLRDFAHTQDGEVRAFEYRVRHFRDENGWHSMYSRDRVMTRNAAGEIQQLVGVVVDVTRQRQQEVALAETKDFTHSILEGSADCIKILDMQGNLLAMNTPGLCIMEIDDFSPFVGKSWADFWQGDEHKLARAAVEQAQKGEVAHFRGFCRTYKGTPKWWDVMVSPVLSRSGKPQRLLSVSRDITQFMEAERALAESERKLRLATLGAQLGLWFWNLETNELTWTEVCKKLFGIPPEEEITYERFLSVLHPDDRALTAEAVQDALLQKHEYNVEYRVVWPDQSVHWIAARGRGFYNEAGQAVQMMGMARDITTRKRAEQERERLLRRERELRAQAEQANRIKEEFLSVISHELRTPLNHMYGWIKMLRAGKLTPEESTEALDTIERNAAAQNRLIEDLLDVSRVITGKLRLDIRKFDPEVVIRAAVDSVRPAADAKGIQLHLHLARQGGTMAGDADRLQQVVWNLLSNAIKFTPQGGHVTVQLDYLDGELIIAVTDTGQGIDPDFLPFVFDRFRQADSSITRQQSGLGLGLAIVRHLVELHGGTVSAHSTGAEQGATFRISLPAQTMQAVTVPIAQAEDEEPQLTELQDLPSLKGLKVLAVDDEPDARQLVQVMLQMAGAEVRTAADIGQAQQVLEEWPPDVLVSDIGMPNGSGYELIQTIRQQERGTPHYLPAIALTAYSRAEDRMRALTAGFQMHVAKPVEPAELVTVVASLSGRI